MWYAIKWDNQTISIKSKSLEGVRRKLWMLKSARITRADGAAWDWNGKQLIPI